MRKYFLYYDEKANVNYSLLFALFSIAQANNVIVYSNINELKNRFKTICNYEISVSTISRALNDKENYIDYFSKSENENKIILNTDYKNLKNKFIVLTDKEIEFLLNENNKMLNKYYIYLKYYCGYAKTKRIDTTANQILSAIGYSSNCGNNKNNLCRFNTLLLDKGFISIDKVKDNKGFWRNIYSMNL